MYSKKRKRNKPYLTYNLTTTRLLKSNRLSLSFLLSLILHKGEKIVLEIHKTLKKDYVDGIWCAKDNKRPLTGRVLSYMF